MLNNIVYFTYATLVTMCIQLFFTQQPRKLWWSYHRYLWTILQCFTVVLCE